MTQLPQRQADLPFRLEDLLMDEDREQLRRDLAEIAASRRRAWAMSQGLVIG